jgi:aspartyl-tRNA(Asn)/glutamyl-tRNA(Gln) amidotransferase subunit A
MGSPQSAAARVKAAVKGAEATQPVLNAFTLIEPERALDRANELDGNAPSGPLWGVPIGLKDLIDHAGRPTTCGSGFYREIPSRSAPVVDLVERAGAVVIGRTNLHEFAYGFSSENHWFGPVRNPWNPANSPGGSSGGSAVAVAAGIVPIAIGTDTGGSVRVPAAMTGIMGLKLTHGRTSTKGIFPLAWSLDTVGPLARTVADLAVTYQAISDLEIGPIGRRSLAGLRVAVPQPWVEAGPTSREVSVAFQGFCRNLEELGAQLLTIEDPIFLPFGKIGELVGAEAAFVHRPLIEQGKTYGPEVARRLDVALGVTPTEYLEAQRWRSELQAATAATFRQADLLLTPSVADMHKPIGEDMIGEHHYRIVLSWFSALVNHTGCPAISLPLATEGNPPPSIQLIAPWWQESLALAVASELEWNGTIGVTDPPGYTGFRPE